MNIDFIHSNQRKLKLIRNVENELKNWLLEHCDHRNKITREDLIEDEEIYECSDCGLFLVYNIFSNQYLEY